MLFYPKINNPEILNTKQLRHITNLFKTANDITDLHALVEEAQSSRFQSDLLRFLISDLHTWRYGFTSLNCDLFRDIFPHRHALSLEILKAFDELFGDVSNLRNVLQHYEKYIFGLQQAARVKQSELDKIDAPITLNGGKLEQFQSCLVGDRFCGSGMNGEISSVYVGQYLVGNVVDILEMTCERMSDESALEISIEYFDDLRKYEKALEDLKAGRGLPTDGWIVVNCRFSTKTDIDRKEIDEQQQP